MVSLTALGVALPLYSFPLDGAWDPFVNVMKAYPNTRFDVIVNPSNGPGDVQMNSDYKAGMQTLNGLSNVVTYGYVKTGWGSINEDTVKAQAAQYAGWQANDGVHVSGIFLDEAPTGAGNKTYMENLYAAIKDLDFAAPLGGAGTTETTGTETKDTNTDTAASSAAPSASAPAAAPAGSSTTAASETESTPAAPAQESAGSSESTDDYSTTTGSGASDDTEVDGTESDGTESDGTETSTPADSESESSATETPAPEAPESESSGSETSPSSSTPTGGSRKQDCDKRKKKHQRPSTVQRRAAGNGLVWTNPGTYVNLDVFVDSADTITAFESPYEDFLKEKTDIMNALNKACIMILEWSGPSDEDLKNFVASLHEVGAKSAFASEPNGAEYQSTSAVWEKLAGAIDAAAKSA